MQKNIRTVYLLVGNGRNKNPLHTFGCLRLFVHSVNGKCSPFANMAASEYWAQLESMQWKFKNILQTIAAIGWVPPLTLNSRILILLNFSLTVKLHKWESAAVTALLKACRVNYRCLHCLPVAFMLYIASAICTN